MGKLEYSVLTAVSLINETQLVELAMQGWELVTIVKDGGLFFFYFKRWVTS